MSHEKFEVGEIALLECPWDVYHGQPVEVIGGLEVLVGYCRATGERRVAPKYRIRTVNGHEMQAYPHELRKRRPPQDWVKLCGLADVDVDIKVRAEVCGV